MAAAQGPPEPSEPQTLVVRIERLLDEIERLQDGGARHKALEVVQALLDLYGAGLERIVQEVGARKDDELVAALLGDELVSHLLLLHGLHPLPVERRVVGALDEVRPYLESHGGGVELLGVAGEQVRLRLFGSCSGCPSSTMTLKLAIENAIHKAAPEIEEVVAEDGGVAESGLLQIEMAPQPPGSTALPRPALEAVEAEWTMVGGLPELSASDLVVKQVAGQRILFLALQGRFYGYRPACPVCGESLSEAELHGYELRCRGCGSRFDALRAGRCLDSPQLHLEPVPLLVSDDGLVKVALPIAA
jgi:Fe-S cluster biogenesis protein NfuA/nitrite reductase/ring-hydroxylating ferredoxin subunit